MRIVTYTDPFKINNNKELWELITSHPHYCASDTLVQGLIKKYGRISFGTIRSIKDFLSAFLGEYTDNPVNDMQLFVTVCDLIRKMPDGPIKETFLFNKAEVVQAIQLLLPLRCRKDRFFLSDLKEEQNIFLNLYDQVTASPCYENFSCLDQKNYEDYVQAVTISECAEIQYLCNNDLGNLKEKFVNLLKVHGLSSYKISNDPEAAIEAATLLEDFLDQQMRARTIRADPKKLNAIRHAKSYCRQQDSEYYRTIIIDGVHRFTPILYYAVKKLEEIGVEVIFMINYAKDLPAIYGTWDRVYEWCDVPFEYAEPIDFSTGRDLGRAIVEALKGNRIPSNLDCIFSRYDNMTEFIMTDIAQQFRNAGHKLSKMSTQYYAVNGNHCNEMLQMYFPDDYSGKAFLSYPIGQLILGLYNMWDFEKKEIHFAYDKLTECAVSGLFQNSDKILTLLHKTQLYFSDIETLAEYEQRLGTLIEGNSLRANDPLYEGWDRISFYSLTGQDLADLDSFVHRIAEYARLIFSDMSEEMEYLSHFRKLVEVITASISKQSRTLSDQEKQLIDEINQRLNTSTDHSVKGNPQDVRDALSFFLAARETKENSDWIVRDFRQLDGAVLLSENGTQAEKYSFALLSNEHMLQEMDDELPWPLDQDFFSSYAEVQQGLHAINAANREHRGFLKYALFYASFFTNRRRAIEFSYLAEENGNKQKPYYLLSALGLKENYKNKRLDALFSDREIHTSVPSVKLSVDQETNEMFGVCPYKFLINKIFHADILYYSEFHISYYLTYNMCTILRNLIHSGMEQTDAEEKIGDLLRTFFPFWGEVNDSDIRKETFRLYEQFHENSVETVDRRKKNYLLAKFVENDIDVFARRDYSSLINAYMTDQRIYPDEKGLPPEKFCQDCNFEGICLRQYYDAHADR